MESHKLISVIVPIYNVEAYLKRCINSIVHQTYQNIEIILVDDGSPDNCGMICDNYAKEDSRIKVIHKKNGGLSSARNAGLRIATGEYIGFIDSDDYIEPTMYELTISAMKEKQVNIVCVGIIKENSANGKSIIIRCPAKEIEYDDTSALYEMLHSRNIGVSVWSKLYQSSLFETTRFIEGETNEDVSILLPLHIHQKVFHIAKPLYHYIERQDSITSKYNKEKSTYAWRNSINMIEQISKYYPSLCKDADYYFANQLFKILISYQSQDSIKDKMVKKYFESYKKYWFLLLFSNTFSFVNKLKCILIRINMYKILRKLFRHTKTAKKQSCK